MVKAGSGCEDSRKIKQVLLLVGGDVDSAIEFLLAEQGPDDHIVDNDKISCSVDTLMVISGTDQLSIMGRVAKREQIVNKCFEFHSIKWRAANALNSMQLNGGPPDMGAFCI
ncbi:unnamed protein product [Fraxinus pennsylvanica]|uniref:UBA domain-containing protein n=1 Tax=Fraxinus pennsylvanica TaxID=56036 RepID=A0AAD2DGC5_9LAMI|nr:unnamed protein product [Fraxinus pennsylvanica]